ncbi:MAG: hypothetical protein APR63_11370, partial [Desulfuromonas sp. SDB]
MRWIILVIIWIMPLANHAGWLRTYGYPFTNKGNTLLKTQDNRFIVVGETGYRKLDIYVVSTNLDGDTFWTKNYKYNNYNFTELGKDIVETPDSNYIVLASIDYPNPSILLMKINPSGDIIWTNLIYQNEYYYPRKMVCGFDNSFIIIGSMKDSGSSTDNLFIMKIDTIGNTLWTKIYSADSINTGKSILGLDICRSEDSSFVICGRLGKWLSYDLLLFKVDSAGDSIWMKTYNAGSEDLGISIKTTYDGGYIIAGKTRYDCCNSDTNVDYNIYLVRTDKNGNLRWSRVLGGPFDESGNSVVQTTDKGYLIAGSINLDLYKNENDIYISRIDSMGRIIWEMTYGNPQLDDIAYDVLNTENNGFIITGYIDGEYDWFGVFWHSKLFLLKTDSLGVAVEENI